MSKTWTVTTDPEAVEWRRRIAERYPLVSPHRITRLCLRYGLRSAVVNPDLLITEAAYTDTEREAVVRTGDEAEVRT